MGKEAVLADSGQGESEPRRWGWAGEKSDFFSILLGM